MNHTHDMTHLHGPTDAPPPFWRTRYGLGLLVFGAIAAYFLLTEHLAHVVGALPFLLILACPLMHLFMHHGHGGHGDHGHQHAPKPQLEDARKSKSAKQGNAP